MLLPVPQGTAQVRWASLVEWVGNTESVLDDVASVALDTLALVVEATAIHVSLLADSGQVEPVAVRALQTDLLVPIPVLTSDI